VEERLSFRDRLSALSRRELVALVGVTVVIVAGAGLWYARSLPKQVEVQQAKDPGPVPPPAASAPSPTGLGAAATAAPVVSAPPTVLYVHVAGLVRHPGVYEFHSGDRTVDAVTAAGGAKPKADLDLLNLASPLVDGQQILVPAHGQAVVAPPVVPGVSPGSTPADPGAAGGLVNINSATETELETLPGVGPVTAGEIVAYRTEHGPFPSVDSLDDVSGIGPATMEQLRPLVTV
jgi:competence protein ComEA